MKKEVWRVEVGNDSFVFDNHETAYEALVREDKNNGFIHSLDYYKSHNLGFLVGCVCVCLRNQCKSVKKIDVTEEQSVYFIGETKLEGKAACVEYIKSKYPYRVGLDSSNDALIGILKSLGEDVVIKAEDILQGKDLAEEKRKLRKDKFYTAMANFLKREREKQGISREDLSELADVPIDWIEEIETVRANIITSNDFRIIGDPLGVTELDFFKSKECEELDKGKSKEDILAEDIADLYHDVLKPLLDKKKEKKNVL